MRNWLLGLFATGLWIANYLIYFWRDIVAWRRRRRDPAGMAIWRPAPRPAPPPPPPAASPEKLSPAERRRFPPPDPPPRPVRDIDSRASPDAAPSARRRRGSRRWRR